MAKPPRPVPAAFKRLPWPQNLRRRSRRVAFRLRMPAGPAPTAQIHGRESSASPNFFQGGLRHTGRCRRRKSYVQDIAGLAGARCAGAIGRGIAKNAVADADVLLSGSRPHLASRALPSGVSNVSFARLIQQEPRPMPDAASSRLPITRLASCTPLGLFFSPRTSTAVGAP